MVAGLETFLQAATATGSVCVPGWMLSAAVGGPITALVWERRRSATKEDAAEKRAKQVEERLDAIVDALVKEKNHASNTG